MITTYSGRVRNSAKLVQRICVTAAAASAIMSYGIAYHLAVETFIGGVLAFYTGYGVWLAASGSKQLQYSLTIARPSHSPFHTKLYWEQQLSHEQGLPRLFLQVITTWERADDESAGELESCKVIHARGAMQQQWMEQLEHVPAGVYRHKHTRCMTGDIWGWFTKEWVCESTEALPQLIPEMVLLPEAVQWQPAEDQLPRTSVEEGAVPYSYIHNRQEGQLSPELRAYQQGDDARTVHWRHYVKTRQMAVRIRLPEQSDIITLIVDDVIYEDHHAAEARAKLRADLRTIAAEWLWRAWQQGMTVQVRWLSDGRCLTQPQEIARELVKRSYSRNELYPVPPNQACDRRTLQTAIDLPLVRDTVLISIADQEDALERLRQQVRGCRLHSWLTVQHHGHK